MPGTVLAAAGVALSAALAVSLCAVSAANVHTQRLAAAADAAALAAADAASGALPGEPCTRAREVAETYGAAVTGCDLDVLIATVTVSAPWGAFDATARARAGPAPPRTTGVGG